MRVRTFRTNAGPCCPRPTPIEFHTGFGLEARSFSRQGSKAGPPALGRRGPWAERTALFMTTKGDTTPDLLSRMRAGDRFAFDRYFERHSARVLVYINYNMGDRLRRRSTRRTSFKTCTSRSTRASRPSARGSRSGAVTGSSSSTCSSSSAGTSRKAPRYGGRNVPRVDPCNPASPSTTPRDRARHAPRAPRRHPVRSGDTP